MLKLFPIYLLMGITCFFHPFDSDHLYQTQENNLTENIWYVNGTANGSQTGLDWGNAFTNLNQALAMAAEGDAIWIAEGTYYPTTTNDREATFLLAKGISLYGGFAGGENDVDERNIFAYPTILSGNIGAIEDSLDNSYHIITAVDTDSSTLLDGIIVSDGYNENEYGCAILLSTETATSGALTVKNCKIENNTGGAILLDVNTKAYFTNCNINYNINGGILDRGQGAEFLNCRFEFNINHVENGGAFISNGVTENASFSNCIFWGNDALDRGLAINILSDYLVINNCVFYGHAHPSSFAPNHHGVIYAYGNGTKLEVNNSIFWSNSRNVARKFSPEITLNNCLLSTQWQGYVNMTLNDIIWNKLPVFNDPYNGDFTLSHCSPAIDAGQIDSLPENIIIDMEGNERIVGTSIDIGAYEVQDFTEACEIFVRDTIDTGIGSLRRAVHIANAHPGADTIKFDMETGTAPYSFTFKGALQLNDDSTLIDATTQPDWEPGAIRFDGSPFDYCYIQDSTANFVIVICNYINQISYPDPGRALTFNADYCGVFGVHFDEYSREAIRVRGQYSQIGKPEKGNYFTFNSWESLADGEVAPNNFGDILIEGDHTFIQANIFGQTPEGEYGGEWGGIRIFPILDGEVGGKIMVGGNRENGEGNIFYNRNQAVIAGGSSPNSIPVLGDGSFFKGNDFIDFQNGWPLNTHRNIFQISESAQYTDLLIENNYFENCREIFFTPLDSTGRMKEVILSKNQFFCNSKLYGTGNNTYQLDTFPKIDENIYPHFISGKALPQDTIEVYLSDNRNCPEKNCQGSIYIGKTAAKQDSTWILENISHLLVPYDKVTAIARDTTGNSSLFTPCVSVSCPTLVVLDTAFCEGEIIELNGIIYEEEGTYFDSIITFDNCETTRQINIEVLSESMFSFDVEICSGEEYTWNEEGYTESGMYFQTFSNQEGCDSIAQLNLEVLPTYTTEIDTLVTNGTLYEGIVINTDTILTTVNTAMNGCDSILITNIFVELTNTFNEKENKIDVTAFPNPFDKKVAFMISNSSMIQSGEIYLYDAKSRLLHQQRFYETQFEIQVDNLSSGIYYYRLTIDEKTIVVGRLVRQGNK